MTAEETRIDTRTLFREMAKASGFILPFNLPQTLSTNILMVLSFSHFNRTLGPTTVEMADPQSPSPIKATLNFFCTVGRGINPLTQGIKKFGRRDFVRIRWTVANSGDLDKENKVNDDHPSMDPMTYLFNELFSSTIPWTSLAVATPCNFCPFIVSFSKASIVASDLPLRSRSVNATYTLRLLPPNPNGQLVLRYHKKHLICEFQYDVPAELEHAILETPFVRGSVRARGLGQGLASKWNQRSEPGESGFNGSIKSP